MISPLNLKRIGGIYMRKKLMLVVVFMTVFFMLSEGPLGNGVFEVASQGNQTVSPVPPVISYPKPYTGYARVTIRWSVSQYTSHTDIHWLGGRYGSSSARKGCCNFSMTYRLRPGCYSFKIHARIRGRDYYSKVTTFRVYLC